MKESPDFDHQALNAQRRTTVSASLAGAPNGASVSMAGNALCSGLAAADMWSNEADLVFTDEFGGPMHPDGFSRSFDRIVRRRAAAHPS